MRLVVRSSHLEVLVSSCSLAVERDAHIAAYIMLQPSNSSRYVFPPVWNGRIHRLSRFDDSWNTLLRPPRAFG